MSGRFILSLDCEGKWGVADHLTPFHRAALTDERLRRAYRDVIDLLARYEIPATFAFVGAFTWSRETADLEALRDFARLAPDYIGPALDDLQTGEGWFGDWAVDMLPAVHETALHGATHLPWDGVEESVAQAELELLRTMPRLAAAETYVFPRNQVNHTHLLRRAGIRGWRERRRMSRFRSFASELNMFSAPDPQGAGIPAGRFVNWKSGVRRLIPRRLTRLRARNMLSAAAKSDGLVHYWTHPENIASAPDTLDVLEDILSEVAEFRRRGLITVVTQRELVSDR